jgi:hypothetical protein
MRGAVLGLLLLIGVAWPGAAQAMRCPVIGSQPQTEVQLTSRNTALNTSKPVRELRQLSANSLGHQPLGLYLARFSSGVQISYDLKREGDEICVWITRVQVQIGYDDRTIYVGNEFVKDGCEYKAILSHEAKHAVTDDSVLAEYNSRFRKNVGEAALNSGMVGPFKRAYLEDAKPRRRSTAAWWVRSSAPISKMPSSSWPTACSAPSAAHSTISSRRASARRRPSTRPRNTAASSASARAVSSTAVERFWASHPSTGSG